MNPLPVFTLSEGVPDFDDVPPNDRSFIYTMTCSHNNIFQVPALVQQADFIHPLPRIRPFLHPLPMHVTIAKVIRPVDNTFTEILLAGDPPYADTTFVFDQDAGLRYFEVRGQIFSGIIQRTSGGFGGPILPYKIIQPFPNGILPEGVEDGDRITIFDRGPLMPMNIPCYFDPDIVVGFAGDGEFDDFSGHLEHHKVRGFPVAARRFGPEIRSCAGIPLILPAAQPLDSVLTEWPTFGAVVPIGLFGTLNFMCPEGWYLWSNNGGGQEEVQRLRVPVPMPDPNNGRSVRDNGRLGAFGTIPMGDISGPEALASQARVPIRAADAAGKDYRGFIFPIA
jgi:hypothetical protein